MSPEEKREKRKQVFQTTPNVAKGSREARRTAAIILEVLAGTRTPTSASEALKVSPPRYYALEARAIEGMMEACEPRKKGPRVSPDRKIAELERENRQLRSDVQRSQALLRLAQRAIGIPKAPEVPKKKAKGKRRKKPMKRALKAVKRLESVPEPPPEVQQEAIPAT